MPTKTEWKILLWRWITHWVALLEATSGVLTFGFWIPMPRGRQLWVDTLMKQLDYCFQYVRETGKQPRF